MTHHPTSREIADRIAKHWRFRLAVAWESIKLGKRIEIHPDHIAHAIEAEQETPGCWQQFADNRRTRGLASADAMTPQCGRIAANWHEQYGIPVTLIISLIGLAIQIWQAWRNRSRPA